MNMSTLHNNPNPLDIDYYSEMYLLQCVQNSLGSIAVQDVQHCNGPFFRQMKLGHGGLD